MSATPINHLNDTLRSIVDDDAPLRHDTYVAKAIEAALHRQDQQAYREVIDLLEQRAGATNAGHCSKLSVKYRTQEQIDASFELRKVQGAFKHFLHSQVV